MNRSAKWLLIVTTSLDGFSLANCRFTKFSKLSTRQTFPLYGIKVLHYMLCIITYVCLLFPYSGDPIPHVEYTPEEINTW